VLDTEIPAGSTRAQIESYLASAHVSYMYAAGTHFQDHKNSLIALAKGTSHGHLLPTSSDEVKIRFRFDESQHLINYDVRTGAERYKWR
jgi:fructose/tagatose bisphosphate aldolase